MPEEPAGARVRGRVAGTGPLSALHLVLLLAGGLFAGTVNAMAGGGSLLTVPLLTVAGVDGLAANGTNRVAVLSQNLSSATTFARKGVGGLRQTLPVLGPVLAGSLVGSLLVSRIADEVFERVFGILMVPVLILGLRPPRPRTDRQPWPAWLSAVAFFGIGLYGGAFQAGVGLVLLVALARAGQDLVTANFVKAVVIFAITAVAVPVFVLNGQVRWLPALILSAGMATGGSLGARLAVRGGEHLIRPVLVMSVLALAGRMLALY
jgi:uncharacterized protein